MSPLPRAHITPMLGLSYPPPALPMFRLTPPPSAPAEQHTEFASEQVAILAMGRLEFVRCMARMHQLHVGPGRLRVGFAEVLDFPIRREGRSLYISLILVPPIHLDVLRDHAQREALKQASFWKRWQLRSEWWTYPTSLWAQELETAGWKLLKELIQRNTQVGAIDLEPINR